MKLTTPYRYAKLIGVSSQAVYQRIKKGQIKTVQVQSVDGQIKQYIDLERYYVPFINK